MLRCIVIGACAVQFLHYVPLYRNTQYYATLNCSRENAFMRRRLIKLSNLVYILRDGTQVRIDRRPTVGPTLLKLVQPCWLEVGPTNEMITLSVHWREQLARRWVPEMGRPRSKYAFTRVENEIRAVSGPDKVHYLITKLLVRY